MKEALLNLVYGFPVLLPMFLAGSMARFTRRGKPGGWRITALGAAVTAVVWLIALVLSRNGSELPVLRRTLLRASRWGRQCAASVCGCAAWTDDAFLK